MIDELFKVAFIHRDWPSYTNSWEYILDNHILTFIIVAWLIKDGLLIINNEASFIILRRKR
jgi:hypothetical protein